MANITELLAALSNLPPVSGAAPLTPLPGTVQPPTDFNLPMSLTMPGAPPAAPGMPLDQSIIQRYLAMAGPAPTAPGTQAPAGLLDKIAAALSGVSAGFQGQGPQFAASLRAERERPQREYEARRQQYEQQRAQFGLRGLEAAQSAEERRQKRENRAADRQFEREFNENVRRMNFTDQREIEKLRDAMLSKRQREDDERQALREAEKYKQQQERDARLFASKFSAQGAKGKIAKDLGDYYAGLTDQIPPEAAKWESASAQANQIRARREARLAGGGGGGGGTSAAAQKTLQQFESIKQQVADAVARGDAAGEQLLRRQMTSAISRLTRFPGQFDIDMTGQFPVVRPRGGQTGQPMVTQDPRGGFQGPPTQPPAPSGAPPAQSGKTVTSQQIRDAAKEAGISFKEAAKQFTDAGYSIRL